MMIKMSTKKKIPSWNVTEITPHHSGSDKEADVTIGYAQSDDTVAAQMLKTHRDQSAAKVASGVVSFSESKEDVVETRKSVASTNIHAIRRLGGLTLDHDEDEGGIFTRCFRSKKRKPVSSVGQVDLGTKAALVDASFPWLQIEKETKKTIFNYREVRTDRSATIDENFNLEKVLTKACLGEVWSAYRRIPQNKKKQTRGETVALRLMSKRFCDRGHVAQELEFVKAVNNVAFAVQMADHFQIPTHFVIVMKYATRGTLHDRAKMVRAFSEMVARFYAAEIAEALFGLHYKGIIHRTLNLDNVLICENGHIVVSDFCLSVKADPNDEHMRCDPWKSGKTETQFPAPELLMGEPYDKSLDWWAFGNILFRMICGEFPFSPRLTKKDRLKSDTEAELDNMFHPEVYPMFVSPCAKKLISRLLHRDRLRRLGNGCHEEYDIASNLFFQSVDWSVLKEQLLPAPFNFMCQVPPTRKRLAVSLPYSPEDILKPVTTSPHLSSQSSIDESDPTKKKDKTLLTPVIVIGDTPRAANTYSHSPDRPPRVHNRSRPNVSEDVSGLHSAINLTIPEDDQDRSKSGSRSLFGQFLTTGTAKVNPSPLDGVSQASSCNTPATSSHKKNFLTSGSQKSLFAAVSHTVGRLGSLNKARDSQSQP